MSIFAGDAYEDMSLPNQADMDAADAAAETKAAEQLNAGYDLARLYRVDELPPIPPAAGAVAMKDTLEVEQTDVSRLMDLPGFENIF